MKTFVVILLTVHLVFVQGRPQTSAKTLVYTNDNDGLGKYNFKYETDNGITYAEEGNVADIASNTSSLVSQGNYKYYAPNGALISVTYTADENGYRPRVNIVYEAKVRPSSPPLVPLVPSAPSVPSSPAPPRTPPQLPPTPTTEPPVVVFLPPPAIASLVG